MSGLEPHDLLNLLKGDLAPFVRQHRGLLSVAADPWNFLELLAERPSGWRLVLHWAGDENAQEAALEGCFCANRIELGVSCNLGLTATPGEQVSKRRAGGAPSLLELVALTRARVRGYVFPDHVSDRFPLYRRCDPVTLPDGTPLAAYRLRFDLTSTPEPVVHRNL